MAKRRHVAALLAISLLSTPALARIVVWSDFEGADAEWLKATAGSDVTVQPGVDIEVAMFERDEVETPSPDAIVIASNLTGLAKDWDLAPVPREILSAVEPAAVNAVSRGPTAYAVPIATADTLLLYVNERLARPSAETSVRALLADSDHGLSWPVNRGFFFVPVMGSLAASSAAFDQAVERLRRWGAGRLIACEDRCTPERFLNGDIAYMIGLSSLRRSARRALGASLRVGPLPPLEPGGAPLRSLCGVYALAFPNHSLAGPHGAELRALAKRLLAPAAQAQAFRVTGRLPVTKDLRAAADRWGDADDRVYAAAARQALPMPNTRATAAYWPAVRKVLTIALGDTEPLPHPGATLDRIRGEFVARFEALP